MSRTSLTRLDWRCRAAGSTGSGVRGEEVRQGSGGHTGLAGGGRGLCWHQSAPRRLPLMSACATSPLAHAQAQLHSPQAAEFANRKLPAVHPSQCCCLFRSSVQVPQAAASAPAARWAIERLAPHAASRGCAPLQRLLHLQLSLTPLRDAWRFSLGRVVTT